MKVYSNNAVVNRVLDEIYNGIHEFVREYSEIVRRGKGFIISYLQSILFYTNSVFFGRLWDWVGENVEEGFLYNTFLHHYIWDKGINYRTKKTTLKKCDDEIRDKSFEVWGMVMKVSGKYYVVRVIRKPLFQIIIEGREISLEKLEEYRKYSTLIIK